MTLVRAATSSAVGPAEAPPTGRQLLIVLLASGAIGFYHAGVELHYFKGFTQCTSTVTGGSTEDFLKAIMSAPLVRCDDVQWSFLGISMAGWNAILSLGGALMILWLSPRRTRRPI